MPALNKSVIFLGLTLSLAMAIYEIETNNFGPQLILRGPWRDSLRRVMEKQDIKQLRLVYSDGWRGKNLDFLSQFGHLEALHVWDQSGLDVSGISFLHNLKRLRLMIWDTLSRPIVFENLVRLESCEMEWNTALQSVLNCPWVKKLVISDVKGVGRLDLGRMEQLEEFWLTRAYKMTEILFPFRSRLLKVFLRKIPLLQTVNAWSMAPELEYLLLSECKRLDLSEVMGAESLAELELLNMGSIPSLKFITGLSCLRRLRLSGRTEVVDGNLSLLLKQPALKRATFAPRKHYDITSQQVSEIIASRK